MFSSRIWSVTVIRVRCSIIAGEDWAITVTRSASREMLSYHGNRLNSNLTLLTAPPMYCMVTGAMTSVGTCSKAVKKKYSIRNFSPAGCNTVLWHPWCELTLQRMRSWIKNYGISKGIISKPYVTRSYSATNWLLIYIRWPGRLTIMVFLSAARCITIILKPKRHTISETNTCLVTRFW